MNIPLIARPARTLLFTCFVETKKVAIAIREKLTYVSAPVNRPLTPKKLWVEFVVEVNAVIKTHPINKKFKMTNIGKCELFWVLIFPNIPGSRENAKVTSSTIFGKLTGSKVDAVQTNIVTAGIP